MFKFRYLSHSQVDYPIVGGSYALGNGIVKERMDSTIVAVHTDDPNIIGYVVDTLVQNRNSN